MLSYRLLNDILWHSSASREIANHSIQKRKLLNDTVGEFFFVGHQLLAPLSERSVGVTCTQRSSLRGSRVTAHARYLHSFSPGGHELANLGVIRVLFAAILSLGVVIIRKRSAHIVAEFNSDRRTAVRAVQGSFFFDHQSHASFSLAIHFGPEQSRIVANTYTRAEPEFLLQFVRNPYLCQESKQFYSCWSFLACSVFRAVQCIDASLRCG